MTLAVTDRYGLIKALSSQGQPMALWLLANHVSVAATNNEGNESLGHSNFTHDDTFVHFIFTFDLISNAGPLYRIRLRT